MTSYVEGALIQDEKIVHIGHISKWSLWHLIVLGILLLPAVVIGLMFFLLQAYIRYKTTELAITTKRVIVKVGFIRRSTVEININKVESVQVDQSLLGRRVRLWHVGHIRRRHGPGAAARHCGATCLSQGIHRSAGAGPRSLPERTAGQYGGYSPFFVSPCPFVSTLPPWRGSWTLCCATSSPGWAGWSAVCPSSSASLTRFCPSVRCLRTVPELAHGARTLAGVPVWAQLLGSDAQCLAENAARLAEMGSPGIDLNFGCPAKVVNRHGGGAALLQDPELLHRIVAAVRAAVPAHIPVTAKMRLGFLDDDWAVTCAQALEAGGAAELVVHARTKVQGYKPPAYWPRVDDIRAAVKVPVTVNGEIWSVEDARAALGFRAVPPRSCWAVAWWRARRWRAASWPSWAVPRATWGNRGRTGAGKHWAH